MPQESTFVFVGAVVRRERAAEAVAVLPPGDVLVAVRVPRGELDADGLARLSAVGVLFQAVPEEDVTAR